MILFNNHGHEQGGFDHHDDKLIICSWNDMLSSIEESMACIGFLWWRITRPLPELLSSSTILTISQSIYLPPNSQLLFSRNHCVKIELKPTSLVSLRRYDPLLKIG